MEQQIVGGAAAFTPRAPGRVASPARPLLRERGNMENVPPRVDALRAVPQRHPVARLKSAIVDLLADGTGREADQLDDLVAGSVRQRIAAAVRDGVLLKSHDEIGRAGPGVRPVVKQAVKGVIGRAVLAAVIAALVQVQGKRASTSQRTLTPRKTAAQRSAISGVTAMFAAVAAPMSNSAAKASLDLRSNSRWKSFPSIKADSD